MREPPAPTCACPSDLPSGSLSTQHPPIDGRSHPWKSRGSCTDGSPGIRGARDRLGGATDSAVGPPVRSKLPGELIAEGRSTDSKVEAPQYDSEMEAAIGSV